MILFLITEFEITKASCITSKPELPLEVYMRKPVGEVMTSDVQVKHHPGLIQLEDSYVPPIPYPPGMATRLSSAHSQRIGSIRVLFIDLYKYIQHSIRHI